MKKLSILLIALSIFICGCRTLGPYTNFTAIKKPIPPDPSFLIFSEHEEYDGGLLVSQIEDALTKNGFPVISQTVITLQTGEASTYSFWRGKTTGQHTIAIKSLDLTQTPATYVIMANAQTWEFKIIKTQTQELIAKGCFASDIYNEILIVLKNMGIPLKYEQKTPDPSQKNFWQRLFWLEEKSP